MTQPKLTEAQSTYLDFARAMAALAVLFGHAAIMFLEGGVLQGLRIEKFGVLIFFLLSGFLISYSVFRKHDDPHYGFRDYFIDRFCRIYCAFLPALVFVWLVDTLSLAGPIDISPERLGVLSWIEGMINNHNLPTWLGNLFMLQDFPLFQIARRLGAPDSPWFIDEYGSGSPFWTISIEWWIYLSFGMITLMYLRAPRRFRLWHWALLGLVSIEPVYYLVGGNSNCLTLLWILGMTASLLFLRLPAWLESRGWPSRGARFRNACLLATGAALVLMAGRLLSIKFDTGSFLFTEFQFSLFLALAVFALLLAFGAVQQPPALLKRLCRFLADYSFSLYLTHGTVICFIYARYPGPGYDSRRFWLAIVAANVVAIIFWWLFERHYHTVARKLKQMARRGRSPELAPATLGSA